MQPPTSLEAILSELCRDEDEEGWHIYSEKAPWGMLTLPILQPPETTVEG